YHRHRARTEHRPHALGRRLPQALVAGADPDIVLGSRKRDADHLAGRGLAHLEPAGREELEHPAIVPEHVGLEGSDAVAQGDPREVLQEQGAHPLSLVRVRDRHRELGPGAAVWRVPLAAHVASDAQELLRGTAAAHRGEANVTVEIQLGEVAKLFLREHRFCAEEAVVDRLGALAAVQAEQALPVVWTDGAATYRMAV